MGNFGNTLRFLRLDRQMTQDELSSKLGISKSTISMYENGRREPDFEILEAIADFFNVDMNRLLGKITIHPLSPIHYKKQIPILGRISAGMPLLAVEHIEGYEDVDDENIDYGLIVKGNSMINARICEGDVVYVVQDTEIRNGDIVIALINGEDATIKRFYKYNDMVVLKPENPTMKEQHYKPDEVKLLGKVMEAKIRLR
ncbi:MAG: transcriptional repressor LexA [Anaerovoracaceae bacterium]|jgi:repressor LexA